MGSDKPTDPADPRTWWVMLVDAVIGIRRRELAPAQEYLRFVAECRGRKLAEQARAAMMRYVRHQTWADVERWPAWGYACKPPAPAELAPAELATKRGRRGKG